MFRSVTGNPHLIGRYRVAFRRELPVRSIFGTKGEEEVDDGKSPALQILAKCEALHARIQPLNDRLRGPLEKHSYRTTALPFVLLLGNHSSGKSSFVNYVLERKVQTSGVAPTDDSFTIIAPGKTDIDQDGPALVGDPDMGFSGLRQFGPPLVHHMRLKIRADTNASNFMLVDSPGMIDSPVQRSEFEKNSAFDRGYDFEGTVRWFAERADVILLFFDPDKPGTTGETLSIMVNSLAGMDHKLHIILNKADQFKKIHDFARAYGSLCWNLSKMIPRKDLPRIHTMCLPQPAHLATSARDPPPERPLTEAQRAHDREAASEAAGLGAGLADLAATRDEVVSEVRKAPKRRIDNMITRLVDAVNLLLMHATVMEASRKSYSRQLWTGRAQVLAAASGGGGVTGAAAYMGLPPEAIGAAASAGMLGTGGVQLYALKVLEHEEANLLSAEGLNRIFQNHYSNQMAEGDAFVVSVWQRIRDRLQVNLKSLGLGQVSKVSPSELEELRQVLEDEVPKLRRLAAPLDYAELVREGYSK